LQEYPAFLNFTFTVEGGEKQIDPVIVRHALDDPTAAQDVAFDVVDAEGPR